MRKALLLVPLLFAAGCLDAPSSGDDGRLGGGPTPGTGATPSPPAASTPAPTVATPLPGYDGQGFRSLEAGQDSASEEAARRVFTEEGAWESFYDNHTKPYFEGGSLEEQRKPAPEVDFTRERAVAVLLGQKPNGCYAIRVEEVREEAEETVVRVVSYEPGPGMACSMALVQPYHLVAIPLRDTQVRFEEQRQVGTVPAEPEA